MVAVLSLLAGVRLGPKQRVGFGTVECSMGVCCVVSEREKNV